MLRLTPCLNTPKFEAQTAISVRTYPSCKPVLPLFVAPCSRGLVAEDWAGGQHSQAGDTHAASVRPAVAAAEGQAENPGSPGPDS